MRWISKNINNCKARIKSKCPIYKIRTINNWTIILYKELSNFKKIIIYFKLKIILKLIRIPTEIFNKDIFKIALKILKTLYLTQYNIYKIQGKKKK